MKGSHTKNNALESSRYDVTKAQNDLALLYSVYLRSAL